jgi:hypothetical protein
MTYRKKGIKKQASQAAKMSLVARGKKVLKEKLKRNLKRNISGIN